MGDSERPRPWLASLSPPHQAVPAPVRLQRRYEAAQRGHGNSAVTSPRAGVLSRDVAYRPHLPPGSVLRKRRRNALYPPIGLTVRCGGPRVCSCAAATCALPSSGLCTQDGTAPQRRRKEESTKTISQAKASSWWLCFREGHFHFHFSASPFLQCLLVCVVHVYDCCNTV